jgi:hypothetical protein
VLEELVTALKADEIRVDEPFSFSFSPGTMTLNPALFEGTASTIDGHFGSS